MFISISTNVSYRTDRSYKLRSERTRARLELYPGPFCCGVTRFALNAWTLLFILDYLNCSLSARIQEKPLKHFRSSSHSHHTSCPLLKRTLTHHWPHELTLCLLFMAIGLVMVNFTPPPGQEPLWAAVGAFQSDFICASVVSNMQTQRWICTFTRGTNSGLSFETGGMKSQWPDEMSS